MLDYRIHTFLAVCRHMNFTHAAEELNLTQPAVSQHIRALEQYYGKKLFEYQGKILRLTEQGQYLRQAMQTVSHDSLRIWETVGQIEKRRRIRIGATLSIGEFFLPPRLSAFMEAHPELDLSVTVADTAELLPLLDGGAVDLVLCEGYFNKLQYAHRLLRKEPMCIFCGASYDRSGISRLEDLFSHRLLLREPGSGTREILERYLRENNYSLENFTSCSDFTSPHLMLRLLLDGQGISVLYRTVGAACLADGSLQEIELQDFRLAHEFNAIWQKNSMFEADYQQIIRELTEDPPAASI